MRRYYLVLLLSFFLVEVFSDCVTAHGCKYKIIEGGVGIEALYSEESPMSYSRVTVLSPEGGSDPYLTGVTDLTGRFLFVPNVKGKWIVKVNDEMGHALEARIDVGEGFQVSVSSSGSLSVLQMGVMSICVIIGMVGIALYFKRS